MAKAEMQLQIIAGAESKAFLAGLTTIADRFEKIAATLGAIEPGKSTKAKASKATAADDDAEESDDEDEDDFAQKPAKKGAPKGFEDDEDEESDDEESEEESDDDAEDADSDDDEESDDEDDSEEETEEKPAKQTKGKTPKLTKKDVMVACKEAALRLSTGKSKMSGEDARAEIKKTLKKFGTKSVDTLDTAKYQTVITAMNALAPATKKKGK